MLRNTIKISFKLYFTLLKKTLYFTLLFVGIFISILGISVTLSRSVMVYETGSDNYRETKRLSITSNNEAASHNQLKKVYDLLFDKEMNFEIYKLIASAKESDTIGYYSGNNKSLSIPYGHFFTSKEINGGKYILLSDAYLSKLDTDFLEDMLHQSIKIVGSGEDFQIVGRYNGTLVKELIVSQEICIPLKTYIDIGLTMDKMEIIFENELNSKQLSAMQELFRQDLESFSVEWPNDFERKSIILFIQSFLSNLIIFVLFFITIFNLFKFWIKDNLKRFYVYYICGCPTYRILAFLLLNTCYIYWFPTLLTLPLYKYWEKYLKDFQYLTVLNLSQLFSIYFIVFICMLFAVLAVGSKHMKNFKENREILT